MEKKDLVEGMSLYIYKLRMDGRIPRRRAIRMH